MAFYGVNDIKKLVTMEIIRFIMQNQDYVLNNTSYGSDLSYEVGCERSDGKKEMLCGLKGLARWEGDQLIDNDKFIMVYQEYKNLKEYKKALYMDYKAYYADSIYENMLYLLGA